MRYLVRICKYKDDYSAEVPDLPGCVAVAKTVEGVGNLMTKAIAMHVELMQESGEDVPPPRQDAHLAPAEMQDVACFTWVDVDLKRPVHEAAN